MTKDDKNKNDNKNNKTINNKSIKISLQVINICLIINN